MTEEPNDDLVELYRARGLPEAQALFFRLEEAGIAARIDNELLQGVIGEIPAGWNTAPRVLVAGRHLAAAQEVLRGFLPPAGGPLSGDDGGDLHCLACAAPMGTADTCLVCGWSYEPEANSESPPPIAPSDGPPPTHSRSSAESTAPVDTGPAPMVGRVAWLEVVAVLAVGVLPHLFGIIWRPSSPVPYWVDTVQLTGSCICTVIVVLYLIYRSGEPWERFGLVRPSGWDIPLGFGILVIAELVWLVTLRMGLPDNPTPYPFPVPRSQADYAMMVIKLGAYAFAVELVIRAYLITRLEVLLRSRGKAVLLSAVVFASYQAYLGLYDAIFIFCLGVAFGLAYLGVRRVWPLAIGQMLFGIHAELSP